VTDRVSLAQEVRDRTMELGKLNDQLNQQKGELEQKTRELKLAYDELQRTHTKMLQQEKMASIGQLAAGIAHEINTPIQFVGDNISFLHESFDDLLNCIAKYQEITIQADKNNGELIKLYSQIESAIDEADFDYLKSEVPLAFDQTADGVKQVAEIVQAMRSFAHFGNATLGPIEMDELIRSTVEITRNSWRQVADLTLELATPPLIVNGLHGELGQVLLNLIINAVDAIAYAPCQKKIPGHIQIQTRYTDDWGEIVVTDSGCGIDQSIQDKIFEPFFTTKDVGKGSGQGLSIAYNIVTEAHGGELLVESKPGEGSSFIVRLPLHKEP
jgi:signal transduction histidine kinase